jgi:hypothetical protein
MSAISSGVAYGRTRGSAKPARSASGVRAAIPVSVGPGATTFTRIPDAMTSLATA